jgi:predicted Zn-dependent protease
MTSHVTQHAFPDAFRLSPGSSYPSPTVTPSDLDWNNLCGRVQAIINVIEAERKNVHASVLVQECVGLSIEKDDLEERIVFGTGFPITATGASAVVSVTDGIQTTEWATTNLDELEAVPTVLKPRLATFGDCSGLLPERTAIEADFVTGVQRELNSVPVAEKLALVRDDYRRMLGVTPNARRRVTVYREALSIELFVARDTRMRQQLSRVTRAIYAVLPRRSGGQTEARAGRDIAGGFEAAPLPEARWQRFEHGVALLPTTKPIPPGNYDLILDGEWAGMLAHESFGHGSEADVIVCGRTRAEQFLGNRVGSPLLWIQDSPSMPGRSGSFFFDHQGTLAGTTQIIREGIFTAPLTDRASARELGFLPSANGRRQSPLHKSYVRMTNTDVLPGNTPLEDMVADVEHGFYLEFPLGGMEDPKGWGVQIEGLLAREIQNGSFSGRCFGPVVLTGYLPDLLGSIRCVGDTFQSDGMGYCGKGCKEFVKITSGGPAILLHGRLS